MSIRRAVSSISLGMSFIKGNPHEEEAEFKHLVKTKSMYHAYSIRVGTRIGRLITEPNIQDN